MSQKHEDKLAIFSDRTAERERTIARFEDAHRRAERPSIDDYLSQEGEERHALLLELVHVELEYRLKAGESARVEEYLERYPNLKRDPNAVVELICNEYVLRFRQESGIAVDEYFGRFPEFREVLEKSLAKGIPAQSPDDFIKEDPRQPEREPLDSSRAKPPQPKALKVRCPHCHNPIEVVDTDPLTALQCPSCGSQFNLVSGQSAVGVGPGAPKTIGHFTLLEPVGTGQFGSVWKARDTKLERTVAVKIPRAGQLDPAGNEQFFREARAAAQIKHPNIVSVHEVGREGETVYIVSDFIEGANLKDWLTGQRLTFREAAQLCVKLTLALHEAHQAGVIHRDLKPGNILLNLSGEPYLTDFGLAKRESGEITMTMEGRILGTPAYMSPEQARGEGHHVDCRTDIYSLGVILFELLTGELPFRGSERMLIVQILQDEPPRPRKLLARVPRDLETICLKCLEKEPGRRYPTAEDLAGDLQRYLAGEPIRARPVSSPTRAWRWCKRNPVVAGLSATALALLLLVVLATSVGYIKTSEALTIVESEQQQTKKEWNRAEAERKLAEAALESEAAARREAESRRQQAEAEKQKAEQNLYYARIALAYQSWLGAEVRGAENTLDACPSGFRGWEWGYLKRLSHLELLALRGHSAWICSVAFSPDGKWLATGGYDDTAKIWDATTGQDLLTLCGHSGCVSSVAFSPDGKWLATGSWDLTAKIWDATSGHEVVTLRGHSRTVSSVAFSPDGKRLATGSDDNTAKIWDAMSGQEVFTLRGHSSPAYSLPLTRGLYVAFSPDGKRLATGSWDKTAKIWDATTGQDLLTLGTHSGSIFSVAFSPDGKWLATGSEDGTAKIWDATSGQDLLTLRGHASTVSSVAFSPDGKQLATGTYANTAKIWDAASGQELFTFRGHLGSVSGVAFSPDGKRLATASLDKTAKVWDAASDQEAITLHGHSNQVRSVAFSPDGKWLATGSLDNTAKIWDAAGGRELLTLRGHEHQVYSVAFGPEGKRLATGCKDGTVKIWDATSGQEVLTLRGHSECVPSVAFSPDGRRLATGSVDKTVKIWDVTAGEELLTLRGHSGPVSSLAFSPDGKWLATGSADNTAKIWGVANGQELLTFRGHTGLVYGVVFSLDGKRVATASYDGAAKIWDATSGQELVMLRGHTRAVRSVVFSPDGKRMATGSEDNTAKIWDVTTGREVLTLRGHSNGVYSVAFSPDGRRLATGSADNTARIWEGGVAWEPNSAGFLRDHGAYYAQKNGWDNAFRDLTESIRLDPKFVNAWYYLSLVELRTKRLDAYRRTCGDVLDRFGETQDAATANKAAWTCALAPNAIADWKRCIEMARRAMAAQPENSDVRNTLGTVLYRAGDFQGAVEHLQVASDSQPQGSLTYSWFVLAMAHHRLGHPEEAKKWLDKAVQWTDKTLPEVEAGFGFELTWDRRLILKLFREEAEALLKSPKGDAAPQAPSKEDQTPGKPKP